MIRALEEEEVVGEYHMDRGGDQAADYRGCFHTTLGLPPPRGERSKW